MNQRNKSFLAQDKLGNAIVLECEEIHGQSERISEKIKSLTEILVPSYTQTEVDFAFKNPHAVATDFMLKSLSPLLENVDSVDWNAFDKEVKHVLEQFFVMTNWAQYSGTQDRNIFVLAIDQKTGQQLGVIQFLITPEFKPNNIKAALSGVAPAAQNRGLEKLLVSSVFKLCPEVERLFLHTRSTNQRVISMYESWGFIKFEGGLHYWTDLEYLVNSSDELQKAAGCFVLLS